MKGTVTVIGAGCVGLAIAAKIANSGRELYVLEKNQYYGQETSSRNSQVIHSGIYYPPGSFKARLCIEGNRCLYQVCEDNGIPYKKIGKLIVATNSQEVPKLEKLLKNGCENGVDNLKLLWEEDFFQMEPNVKGVCAIYSPSTGIIDSHALMDYFFASAKNGGALFSFKTEVIGIDLERNGYRLTVRDPSGYFSFHTDVLINSAGLNSDKIAELAGIDLQDACYRLHYCKGIYFSVKPGRANLVKMLIYPVPPDKGGGLGIHATIDLGGRIRLGPNAVYITDLDYKVDDTYKMLFYDAVKKYLPSLGFDDIEPDMAGIRPKLAGPQDGFKDFVIIHEEKRNLSGFINLIGIESPGLTASPAIAEYVATMVDSLGI